MRLVEVDTITLNNGTQRRRVHWNLDELQNRDWYWIDGLGANDHPFVPYRTFIDEIDGEQRTLQCFYTEPDLDNPIWQHEWFMNCYDYLYSPNPGFANSDLLFFPLAALKILAVALAMPVVFALPEEKIASSRFSQILTWRSIVTAATLLEREIRVFPNPVTDILNIEGVPVGISLTLVAADGRKVSYSKTSSIPVITVDLNALPSGFYTYYLYSDKGKLALYEIVWYD